MRARTSVSPTDTPRCVDPQLDRKEKARSRGPFTRNEHKRNPAGAGFQKSCYAVRPRRDNYIGSTASACRPFWPWTTVNVTFWPSFRLLKPWDWIARKCTNTSSPFSRLMKPKPLASLNHLTVPVSRFDICIAPSAVGRFAGVRRYSAAATYARIRENATGVKTPPPPRPNPRKEAPNESATDVRPGRPARRRRPGRRGAAGTAGLAAGLRRHADRGVGRGIRESGCFHARRARPAHAGVLRRRLLGHGARGQAGRRQQEGHGRCRAGDVRGSVLRPDRPVRRSFRRRAGRRTDPRPRTAHRGEGGLRHVARAGARHRAQARPGLRDARDLRVRLVLLTRSY